MKGIDSKLSRIFAALLLVAAVCVATPAQAATVVPAKATFAGGCFWCMQGPFDRLDGVISTTAGYTGGSKKSPTYHEVSSGNTGHAESVQVLYDPKRVSYEKLLDA